MLRRITGTRPAAVPTMIVRLATFASPTPDVWAEAMRNVLERFQPALVAQPGFVAGYYAEDGRVDSITVWESEAAATVVGREPRHRSRLHPALGPP